MISHPLLSIIVGLLIIAVVALIVAFFAGREPQWKSKARKIDKQCKNLFTEQQYKDMQAGLNAEKRRREDGDHWLNQV